MDGKVFSDYSLIDMSTLEGRKRVFGAVTAFMRQPAKVHDKMRKLGIAAFTGADEFPREVKELIEKLHLGLEQVDIGYERFFDTRNYAGTPASGFRVRDVSSGLTFSKRPEGGRAHIYRITGTEKFVSFDTYGGGLEFDQAWFDDQEWWLVEDTAAEFRSGWYRDKATTMYDLVGNLGAGYNTAFNTDDITTINDGCYALLSGLKTAGYNVTADTPIVLLSPQKLKSRIQKALAQLQVVTGIAASQTVVEYNVTPVYSLNVRNAGAACVDKWYLGVPGLKNKLGEKMPLTVFSDFNIKVYATTTVGWGRYGAYMNEVQFRRLAIA